MKVVILAGGLGTRMREETEFRPKPMVQVGGKPVLWHIMKTYAGHGHTDFVICAGYKGDQIKDYFYNYAPQNLDFSIQLGNQSSAVFHGSHDEFDWTVTVADTGHDTPTGGRINRVRQYLNGEPFFATYGDGIANVNITQLLNHHKTGGKSATITTATPRSRFGLVDVNGEGLVTGFTEKPEINGYASIGYFVFEQSVFQHLDDESILEEDPLKEMARAGQVNGFHHKGFWQPMDTYREAKMLNELWDSQAPPWKTW
jgi:glucose-1-phosphate cytidylyltransferase